MIPRRQKDIVEEALAFAGLALFIAGSLLLDVGVNPAAPLPSAARSGVGLSKDGPSIARPPRQPLAAPILPARPPAHAVDLGGSGSAYAGDRMGSFHSDRIARLIEGERP